VWWSSLSAVIISIGAEEAPGSWVGKSQAKIKTFWGGSLTALLEYID